MTRSRRPHLEHREQLAPGGHPDFSTTVGGGEMVVGLRPA